MTWTQHNWTITNSFEVCLKSREYKIMICKDIANDYRMCVCVCVCFCNCVFMCLWSIQSLPQLKGSISLPRLLCSLSLQTHRVDYAPGWPRKTSVLFCFQFGFTRFYSLSVFVRPGTWCTHLMNVCTSWHLMYTLIVCRTSWDLMSTFIVCCTSSHLMYTLILCCMSWHLMYALIVCSTSWHLMYTLNVCCTSRHLMYTLILCCMSWHLYAHLCMSYLIIALSCVASYPSDL